MRLRIGNNDHHIGCVEVNEGNLKKFMIIAALGFTVFTAVGCKANDKSVVGVLETRDVEDQEDTYTYSYEPRYSGIEYKVQWGDTLTEIVAAYESDYNRILRYVDDIERANKLKGILRQGITIELCGVPESKLINYGYTSDYAIVGYDLMVVDAYEWLLEEKQWIVETERNAEEVLEFNKCFNDFERMYNSYLSIEDEVLKQEKLDELVVLLNELLGKFKQLTGLDFEQHHKAYPIPEEYSYENTY